MKKEIIMGNLNFNLDSIEKEKILEMHKNATKKMYLIENVVKEQQSCPPGQTYDSIVKRCVLPTVTVTGSTATKPQNIDYYVKEAQKLLGFTGNDVDGKFGPKTFEKFKKML